MAISTMSAPGSVASSDETFGARNKLRGVVPSASRSSLAFAGSVMEIAAGRCLRVCSSEQFDIVARRQAEQADLIRQILSHFDRAGADGAGAAEEDDVLHRVTGASGHAANTDT